MKNVLKVLWIVCSWIALQILAISCGPSPEEVAFQTQAAETATAGAWTATLTDTPTPSKTPNPSPTSTSTPTITPTPTPTPFAGGGQIAFQVLRPDRQISLYVMDPDGNNLREIFDTSQLGIQYSFNLSGDSRDNLAWSPDGKSLLVRLRSIEQNYRNYLEVLLLVHLETASFSRIEPSAIKFDTFGWSSTGSHYYYSFPDYYGEGSGCPLCINAYKNKLVNSTDNQTDYMRSIFDIVYGMRSEGHLLFMADERQDFSHFYDFDTNTRNKTILTESFSRDYKGVKVGDVYYSTGAGHTVSDDASGVYIRDCDPTADSYTCTLYHLGFDGSEMQTVLQLQGEFMYSIDISPDNLRIAFDRCRFYAKEFDIGACRVSYFDVKNNEIVDVLDSEYLPRYPIWSPDGNHILYLDDSKKYFHSHSIPNDMTKEIPLDLEGQYEIRSNPEW